MISFVIGALVTVFTFYIALIYSSVTIGLLGFAEAILLVLAFLFLLWYRRKIEADIQIPIAVAEPGEKVRLMLAVRNQSRISCMKIKYQITCENAFIGKSERAWQKGAPVYHGKNEYQQVIYPEYAGNYEFGLKKIKIYDLTGIFCITKKVGRSCNVMIFPEMISVGVHVSEHTRNFFGEAEIYDDFHPGDDPSEIFGVREFRAGDKVQSIHWKLSAKSDDLLVRENSQPKACPLVFLLEPPNSKKKWKKKKGKTKNEEKFLTVVAGVVFSLMDAACPHYVAWYSVSRKDVVRIRIDDEESFYMFLCYYLADGYMAAPQPLSVMYKEKYKRENLLYTMYLDASMHLILNDKEILSLDDKDWKEKMETMELML